MSIRSNGVSSISDLFYSSSSSYNLHQYSHTQTWQQFAGNMGLKMLEEFLSIKPIKQSVPQARKIIPKG